MKRHWRATVPAVAAAAAVGTLGTDPTSSWFTGLRKPGIYPPPQVFGLVWTPLYAALAWASGRALDAAAPADRPALAKALAANLVLNASWNWLFFKARRPDLALAEVVVLEASTVDLARRFAAVDAKAGAAVVPYAAWNGFATVLNAAFVWLNRR